MAVAPVGTPGTRVLSPGLSTVVPIPAHNPGNAIRIHMTYPSDGSGGDGGYLANLPSGGFTEVARAKYNGSTSLQHEFLLFDDGAGAAALTETTVSRAAGAGGTAIGNMTIHVEILSGVSRSTPVDVRAAVAPAQSTVMTYDFASIPAGAYAVLDIAANSGYTILTTPTPTPGWDIQPAVTVNTQNRMLRQAFAATTDPGAISFTASASKFFSLMPLVYLPTASTTATSSDVASVSGDAVLFGGGAMAANLNDTDDLTGVVLLGDGDSADFQMTPVIVPGAGKGFRVTARVQREGGTNGTWTWQLIEGGVVRGEVIKTSAGTSPETQIVRFLNAMTTTVGAPATYWPVAGPVVRVIANYT